MDEERGKQYQNIFNTARPVRGFEDIASQIQEAILSGTLKVGDRLPNERELGAVFGVSRPTLREAIRSLESAGLVEVRRGTSGGTFIAEPGATQVGESLAALIRFRGATADELAEFRRSFESETALWAARRATEDNKRTLLELLEQLKQAAQNKQLPWEDFVDLDLSFHEEVANASRNQIRVAVMLSIHEVLRKNALVIEVVEDLGWREQQVKELAEIATAIVEHRDRMAMRLMRKHVSENAEAVERAGSSQ
ncbi:FadR/GntR family transcriptional regulator [Alicyclobacillus sp. ALC3]|uniref:FadR/GntR family transcriptional regulator n=1 Tax=Alicyclobacillus sp. ALC3 TaxID=2796143 RepID=UPI002378BE25|nr:GntR family transcriptional regulator [Alicyclobacillus sp. ALC3]WDL97651.1 FadR family transcriptional regulator [Alicyclobacillus sp. ALC3]